LTVTACASLLQSIEQKAGHSFTSSARRIGGVDHDPFVIRLRTPLTQRRAVDLLYLVSSELG